MNRSKIVEILQKKYPKLKIEEVESAFNIFTDEISKALNKGDNIELRGFGTLTKKINKEKFVRNPKTNERVFKKNTFKLHFKLGKTLHKRINELNKNEE